MENTTAPCAASRSISTSPGPLRSAGAGSRVEAFVIIGVITILVTRAYLKATGYPQVGGTTLHIAHVLWGGLAMVAALVVAFSFLGDRPRTAAVVIAGVGFGLFLDEVGKFVTKTNDYFYQPAIAIMYVVVVALLLINRAVHDLRPQTPAEDLVNAAGEVAVGLVHGLSPMRRAQVRRQLHRAALAGLDPGTVADVTQLLGRCQPRRAGRFAGLDVRVRNRLSVGFDGPRATWVAALVLAAFSTAGVVSAAVTLSDDLNSGTGTDVTTIGQLCGSAAAFTLCWVAIAWLRTGRIWPVRALRAAALVTMLLTEVFDFVAEEFGALVNVAVGLVVLVVFSRRIAVLELADTSDGAPDAARRESVAAPSR
ncbi:hypothetical protein [Rhodococcus sp. MTM3W5.2]|uniref:hypothetical protein n=1 Tax=Rhodococcus sp. MTM3W5.2 TaxID=1805827 RepID=UPI001CB9A26E|nr:hypothetical protein [Rhodococcus sp. MTM3W5.2]